MKQWRRLAALILIGTTLASMLAGLWVSALNADWLVIVADTRRVSSFILRYFTNLYNTNPGLMAIWVVALTLVCGCIAGLALGALPPQALPDKRMRNSSEL